jgi:hypothetical protein
MSEEDICICCKDLFDKPEDIYKLTCGHIGHYDCFYMSFKFNIKRGASVLECPYCRKNVKPLAEKSEYNYCQFIHGGLPITNINLTKIFQWTPNHEGLGYCKYCKNGNYCNLKIGEWGSGPNKDMCYTHKNYVHYGNNFCKAYKCGKYCNNLITPQTNNQVFCWKHKNLENQVECIYVKPNGVKCGLPTQNTSCKCDKHNIVPTKKTEAYKCKEVFKSGKRKGEICNVINCKRHQQNAFDISNQNLDKITKYDETKLIFKETEVVNNDGINEKTDALIGNDEFILNSENLGKTETSFSELTNGIIINKEQNYNIDSVDEEFTNINYLCADISTLIDDLSNSTDIIVLNSLQVIKSLLISLKKNNNKLNE